MTKAPLIQKVTVNRLFKYYPIQNLQPSTFTRAGRNAQLLKRTADRSDNNDRQWLKCRPTLRRPLLTKFQSTPSSHSAKRENRKENRRLRVGRGSAASELRHCLRQSREFPLVGTGRCLPIQLQWPRICSRARSCIVLLRRSDGSVKEETSIWLPRNTTLLGCLFQG